MTTTFDNSAAGDSAGDDPGTGDSAAKESGTDQSDTSESAAGQVPGAPASAGDDRPSAPSSGGGGSTGGGGGTGGTGPTYGPPAPGPYGAPGPRRRSLRRSRSDRMITGVSGGLGEYFGVDPVFFRVLFAVLSFFGGVGLLMYLACWLLMPEPDVRVSALDRGIAQLRQRRIPPWVVIIAATLILWLGWFSWWAPGPTFPALALIAVILIVLIRRVSTPSTPSGWVGSAPAPGQPWQPEPYPWQVGAAQGDLQQNGEGSGQPTAQSSAAMANAADGEGATQNLLWGAASTRDPDATGATPSQQAFDQQSGDPQAWNQQAWNEQQEPLVPPLNDFRRSMSDWYNEAKAAKKQRQARRKPLKVAVGVTLLVGLGAIGIVDALHRVSFDVYIWFLAALLAGGFLISVIVRRTVWEFVWPLCILIPALVAFGGTTASITDGSGKAGWAPTSEAQLVNEQRFAGDTTLDLTKLPTLTSDRTITITQAAGRISIRVPQTTNATIVGSVHIGDIQVDRLRGTGNYAGGVNTDLTVPPTSSATTGSSLTIKVDLTVGHIQIDRIN
ncbi:PspC domain-containing protein [Jatrophihabitans sp. DSM 45814]